MNAERSALLGQALTVIAMIALIYGRLQNPDNTAARVFGIDWLVLFATGVIAASIILTAWALQSQN